MTIVKADPEALEAYRTSTSRPRALMQNCGTALRTALDSYDANSHSTFALSNMATGPAGLLGDEIDALSLQLAALADAFATSDHLSTDADGVVSVDEGDLAVTAWRDEPSIPAAAFGPDGQAAITAWAEEHPEQLGTWLEEGRTLDLPPSPVGYEIGSTLEGPNFEISYSLSIPAETSAGGLNLSGQPPDWSGTLTGAGGASATVSDGGYVAGFTTGGAGLDFSVAASAGSVEFSASSTADLVLPGPDGSMTTTITIRADLPDGEVPPDGIQVPELPWWLAPAAAAGLLGAGAGLAAGAPAAAGGAAALPGILAGAIPIFIPADLLESFLPNDDPLANTA